MISVFNNLTPHPPLLQERGMGGEVIEFNLQIKLFTTSSCDCLKHPE